MGFKPLSNSQYFTAAVPHTTLWDTTQITFFLCPIVLRRHNSRYYHFSKLWRIFKIGLAASLWILEHFCIPEPQFSTCSGDLACPWTSRAEQSSLQESLCSVCMSLNHIWSCASKTLQNERVAEPWNVHRNQKRQTQRLLFLHSPPVWKSAWKTHSKGEVW